MAELQCPQCGCALSGDKIACSECGYPLSGTAPAERRSPTSERGVLTEEAITASLMEPPIPTAELVEDSPHEDMLELGPRWRPVLRAFSWVNFGVTTLMLALGCNLAAASLPVIFLYGGLQHRATPSLLFLLQGLLLAVAGFALLVGYWFCLQVPAGTRAKPAAVFNLAARFIAFGMTFYGIICSWDADEVGNGRNRDSVLLSALALLLGGWLLTALAEFSFITLLKRVGQFLGNQTVIRRTRWATRILLGYILITLILGAVGVALLQQSISYEIAVWKIHSPKADLRPFSWLLTRIADLLITGNAAWDGAVQGRCLLSALTALFWTALGFQYRAALSAANFAIASGLDRQRNSLTLK